METRKDEEMFRTADTKKMIGNFTAENVKRSWKEDYVDEATGEIVTIERNEMITPKGTKITAEIAQEISFFIQTGDIKDVLVSNQCRLGSLAINTYPSTFAATVSVRDGFKDKNTKLLLSAESIDNAIEIVKDYEELNSSGLFWLKKVEQVAAILIKDTLKEVDKSMEYLKGNIDMENIRIGDTEEKDAETRHYTIEVSVTEIDEQEQKEISGGSYTFIVQTSTIDTAVTAIHRYLDAIEQKREKPQKLVLQLEKAVEAKYNDIIDMEFCKVYFTEK